MKPENRTLSVMHALGWQGGTIHQVCDIIGCDSSEFLYSDVNGVNDMSSDFTKGWYAVRTSWENKDKFIQDNQGNLQFWFGVAAGQNLIDSGE